MEIPSHMKATYLQRRLKDHADCLESIKAKNSDLLERVGHQMKGNAISFGFDELAQLGEQLEDAASEKNWNKISDLIEKFGAYLAQK